MRCRHQGSNLLAVIHQHHFEGGNCCGLAPRWHDLCVPWLRLQAWHRPADSAEERAAPAMTGMRLAAMPHDTRSDLSRKELRRRVKMGSVARSVMTSDTCIMPSAQLRVMKPIVKTAACEEEQTISVEGSQDVTMTVGARKWRRRRECMMIEEQYLG